MIVNRIKELRTARKITLQQMADAVGSSVATVQRVEKGGVDLVHELVEPIAAVLGVPWHELLCVPEASAAGMGLSESAAPFAPEPGHALARIQLAATESMFIAKSDGLDAVGIKTGDVVICDVGRDAVRNVATGDVVVAQIYGPELTTATTVLMQFIAPALLVSNPRRGAVQSINMAVTDAAIKGVARRRFGDMPSSRTVKN